MAMRALHRHGVIEGDMALIRPGRYLGMAADTREITGLRWYLEHIGILA